MRILFIYPGKLGGELPLGVLYLSAMLKAHGHETSLFTVCGPEWHLRLYPYTKLLLRRKLREFSPQLVCFGVVCSTEFQLCLELARVVKRCSNLPIILGGPHPTVDPEGALADEAIDMVCVGEGEQALLELVERIGAGQDAAGVRNIHFRKNGALVRNEARQPGDVNTLPVPDRGLVDVRDLLGAANGANFITGRGCPYRCSYCVNPRLQQLHQGKGPFVRLREIRAVIDEIVSAKERYGIRKVTFSDETFTLSKRRVLEFCAAYRKDVGLPFLCQTRANHLDDEICRALKAAGCESVNIGIESGNDHIRNEVLKRGMSRETIVKAFASARAAGLRTGAFNIIGLPFETEGTIRETIELNREVRPDTALCTMFMPFKGTELRDLCEKNGWLEGENNDSYYRCFVLRLPTVDTRTIYAYQLLFDLYVNADKESLPRLDQIRGIIVRLPCLEFFFRYLWYAWLIGERLARALR